MMARKTGDEMNEITDAPPRGVSRRDLLKRGAIVGVAAAWTVPIIEVVSMTPAHADTPSAPGGGGGGGGGGLGVDPQSLTPPPVTTVQPATGGSATGGTATGGTGLAFTGTEVPVVPAVAGSVAAIALGAGALVAARAHRKSDDADQAPA